MTPSDPDETTTAEVPVPEPSGAAPRRGVMPSDEAVTDELGTEPARAGSTDEAVTGPVTTRLSQVTAGSEALQDLLARARREREEDRRSGDGAGRSGTGKRRSKSGEKSAAQKAAEKSAAQKATSQRTAERIARRTVGKLVSGSSVNTQPVPIVTALRGTPYQAPVQPNEPVEDEARMILDLAADIAAILMRAGAGTQDTEVSVIAACTACGLATVEVDLTSNSLVVHYSTSDGRLLTVLRVNRGESTHYAKLASVHKLVSDLVEGRIEFLEARNRLDAIRSQRRPYQDWFVTGAWGLMVGSFVLLLGGGWISSLLGLIMAIFIYRVGKFIGRTSMPPFFITMLQAAIATFAAMLAGNFDLVDRPQYLVAAGIVLLLPTQSLYSAVQDALTNFPLTAASRMVGVFMTLAGIVSGIAVGLVVGQWSGLNPIEVLVPKTSVHVIAAILSLAAAALIAMTGAVGMQATRRFILPAAVVGLAAHITMTSLTLLQVNNVLASFLAATVAGFLAAPFALRLGAPAIVLTIPAIYTLLQGLSIFAAVYQSIIETETTSFAVGLSALFTALISNAALAVGAVLGSYLARPLQKWTAKASGSKSSVEQVTGATS